MQNGNLILYFTCTVLFCGVQITNGQLVFKKGAPHVKCESHTKVIGSVKTSRGDLPYYEFLGLRYANPPDRFKPATLNRGEHPDLRENVHLANQPGPRCPQQFGKNTIGEEDCLFLNVFIPMRPQPFEDGFPVMVWIHGGAFIFGSGDGYEAQYFMDENVILITINYRLGALGFLSTEDNVAPGNLGLKDQIIALQWVQNNIEFFGGDKKRVTVFGHSAGAASIHYLMLSPMGKGLFHSAIAQSGSVHNFWAFTHNPASTAGELGDLLECKAEDSETLLKCLNGKTVQEIINAQSRMKRWYIDPIAPFGPTVEFYNENDGSTFLSEYPDELIQRREFYKIPLMLGITPDEGLSIDAVGVIQSDKLTNQLDSDFETIAPITFNFRNWFPQKNMKQIASELREFYFGDKSINKETLKNLTNLYSDANFIHGVWKFALEHATEQPVYPYVMAFQDESSFSTTKLFTGLDDKYGVSHGDEIQYLFKSLLFAEEIAGDSEAEKFSKKLVKLWASFATHRKPTETWGPLKWPQISKAQLQGDVPYKWYVLDKDTSILENPFMERKIFWDKLFKKYSKISKDEL